MSWELTLMSDWTSAGGRPVANLGPALPGSSLRFELGARGTSTLVLDADIAWPLVRRRSIVRIDRRSRGAYVELRVISCTRPTRGTEGTQVTATAQPRIYDLADSDLVRKTLAGRAVFAFNENLTPRQYGDEFLWVQQNDDRLNGIRWGVVEFAERIPLQWDRWTRGQLLTAIVNATDAEVQWRIAPDGAEEVDLLKRIGANALPVSLRYGALLESHNISESYADLMTVARVAGEAPVSGGARATIGENVWTVTDVRAESAVQYAIALRAPTSGESPILEDGQYCEHLDLQLPPRYLDLLDARAPLRILASSVARGEVTVVGSPPLIGDRVRIVADADCRPLETLELPSAIRAYGYVARDLQIVGGRGERQYATNGGHENGVVGWSAVNGGAGSEYRRTELGVTRNALANGARAAGVGTGTAFAIKGYTANGWVRRGMELRVGGVTLPIAADAIPSTSGALALSLGAPGLPGSYVDNTPFTLVRREVRTLTLDGVQNPFAPFLKFRDVNTDGMFPNNAGTIASAVGDYTNDFALFDFSGYYDMPGIRAGRVLVNTGPTLQWASYLQDVYIMAGTSLNYLVGEAVGTFTFVSMAAQVAGGTHDTIVVGSVVRTFRSNGQWQYLRVTAIAGSVYSFATIDGAPVVASGGFDLFQVCNRLLADGSLWDFTAIRESRTVYCDGPVSAGATTLPCKPQANLATRNWTATDTISLTRSVSVTLEVTGHTASTYTNVVYDPITGDPVLDEFGDPVVVFGGTQHAITLNLAASTIDEAFAAGDVPNVTIMFGSVAVTINAGGLSGTTLNGVTPGSVIDSGAIPAGTYTAAWTVTDTYTLTGTASWNSNGRVTLALSNPVPSGRSYARGLPVASNWQIGAMRLHEPLNAGAESVEVFGHDEFFSTTTPTASARGAVYRITAGGSSVPIPGNILYAAASVQADSSGNANVVLTTANANAIANNEPIVIRVPALLPVGESPIGSALRLFCPVGGSTPEPSSLTPAQGHALFYVRIPPDATVQLTARSLFTLSINDWFAPQAPAAALVNAAGEILGWSGLDDDGINVTVEPGEVTLTTRAVITQSGLYALRVYGGHATDFTKWCMHLRTVVYAGEALDAPYTGDSFSTPLMLTALRRLQQQSVPRIADRLEVTDLSTALANALEVPTDVIPTLQLGGTVVLEDWQRTERVTAIEERPEAAVAMVEVGQLARDGAQLLGAAAIAAGVRRIR